MVGVRRIAPNASVCVSVCLSVREHNLWNYWTDPYEILCALCRSPVAVARSSSGSVALRYLLPVLLMTSHLAVVGRIDVQGLGVAKYSAPRGVARPGRGVMSTNALFSLHFCMPMVDLLTNNTDRMICVMPLRTGMNVGSSQKCQMLH